MKRRILAWLMTFAMVFNMAMPYTAFADELPVNTDAQVQADENSATSNDDVNEVGSESTADLPAGEDLQDNQGDEPQVDEPIVDEPAIDADDNAEFDGEEDNVTEPTEEPATEPTNEGEADTDDSENTADDEKDPVVAGLLQNFATMAVTEGIMQVTVDTQADDFNTITCPNTNETLYLKTVTVSGAEVVEAVQAVTASDYNYTYAVTLSGATAKDAQITLTTAGGINVDGSVPPNMLVPQADADLSLNSTSLGGVKTVRTATVNLLDGSATAVFKVAPSSAPYTVTNTATHTFTFTVSDKAAIALTGTPTLEQAFTVTKVNMDGVSGETYQWYRVDGDKETKIEGATAATYTPVVDDYACKLKLVVTLADETVLTAVSENAVTYSDISQIQASATVTAEDNAAGIIVRKASGEIVAKGTGSVTATIQKKADYEYYVYKKGCYSVVGNLKSTDGDVTISGVKLKTCDIADSDAWASFRGSDSNMAIVDIATPTAENTLEKWSYKSSINPVYVTPPMLMGDYLIVAYGTSLEKINASDGKLVASGTMQMNSVYTQQPPAYGDGRIYFAQNGGRMEAFDAETLKSLWKYTNKSGGQDSAPILYKDGYVYTGYWGTTSEFVCIDAATGEEKWTKSVAGGFYWAGPVIVGNAVIVGSDNGIIYAWNKLTGEEIATVDAGNRIRSTMSYSKEKGRLYFTTTYVSYKDRETSCYLGSVAVDPTTGAISDLKKTLLTEYGVTECSCTPVVYGDYVYVTAGAGSNQTAKGAFVVAKADTLEVVNTAEMASHTKTSPLLSTAYLETDGCLYFYTEDYSNNSDIELTKVVAADPTKEGNITVTPLVTLSHREYAMNSLTCGKDGTLYLKNDSGYVFAVENAQAYLTELKASVGTFDKTLNGKDTVSVFDLELVAPAGTTKLDLTMTASEGASVSVGGKTLTDGKYTVNLTDGKADVIIKLTKGGYSRNYTVTVRTASTDTGLQVATTKSNAISNNYAAISEYSDGVFVITGATGGTTRVWCGPNDVLGSASKPEIIQGEASYASVGNTYNNIKYAHRMFSSTLPLLYKTTVTAESGKTKDYYVLTIADAAYDGEAYCYELTLNESALTIKENGSAQLTAKVGYIGKNAPTVTYTSDNEAVATVDANGKITAVAKGTANITAAAGGLTATCALDVNDSIQVYMTYSDGDFVKAKDGTTELYNVAVQIPANTDGKYTLDDAFKAFHKKYCSDADGYVRDTESGYITSFWGNENPTIGYMLNNSDLNGALSANTEMNSGDKINVFVFHDVENYAYSDLYTYFDALTDKATVGKEKTFTVNGYAVMNHIVAYPKDATVKVYDSTGAEVENMATTVDENGSFKLKFASTGTYTVEISGKTNYSGEAWGTFTEYENATVVPSRCTVTVGTASGGGGGGGSTPSTDNISVKFRLIGSTLSENGVDLSKGVDDAKYVTWIATKTYTLEKGSTTLDLFKMALDEAKLDYDVESSGWLNCVTAPKSLGGYDLENLTNGDRSGWMYTLNGTHEQATLGNSTLKSGDVFIVHYVNDYLYEDSQWATGCLGTSAQRDRWLKAADTNPVGSGSSNGGGSSSVSTTVNPVVVVGDNGEAKVSISTSEVKVIISEAKEAGAGEVVIAPKISGDADKVTVNIPAISAKTIAKEAETDIRVTTGLADVVLGTDDLKNIGANGNLTVSAEKRDDGSVYVEVTADGKAVKLTDTALTVPVANATAADVLVIVKADGTEEVIKKSLADETGITAMISESCTVKAVHKDVDFADTKAHWAKEAAEFVAARELFNGTDVKTFAPNDNMNRAMVATVLHRLENKPDGGKLTFKDSVDAWAADGVAWAAENEIVNGDEQGCFNGTAPVTRQELAAMLYRYAKAVGLNTTANADIDGFADSEQVAAWASDSLKWAVGTGLIKGNEDGTLNPNGTATRAEVATVIMRLIEMQ